MPTTDINTQLSQQDLANAEKNAIMEQLQDDFNEELESMYLEFIEKLEDLKNKHKENITKATAAQVQNSQATPQ